MCPNLDTDVCERNASASEPVLVNASIVRLSYEVEPTVTLNCATEYKESLRGTLDGLMSDDACTPVMSGGSNATDETGTASLPGLAILSGPPATYTMAFTPGDGVELTAETRVETSVAEVEVLNTGAGVVISLGVAISPHPECAWLTSEASHLPVAQSSPSPRVSQTCTEVRCLARPVSHPSHCP